MTASRSPRSGRPAPRWSSAALCAALLWSGPPVRAAGETTAPPGPDRVLFGTFLADLLDPGKVNLDTLPAEVRARAETYRRRAAAFRSRLPAPGTEPGPETYEREKRQELERGMVALIEARSIEAAASDYAARTTLAYEWEGMSDGPAAEAESAARFLDGRPATPLRPYLELLLAHRFRCAAETFAREGKSLEASLSRQRYHQHLDAALRDPDALVRYAALDLSRRPHLYVDPGEQDAGGCPDTALAEPLPDPRAWALRCFAVDEGDASGQPGSLAELLADLDHDGVPELLLGSSVARGNAGGIHYVFRARGTAYRYLGSLPLHPAACAVLPPSARGLPALRRYVHLGAGEGLLETLAYDGRAFLIVSSRRIAAPSDSADGMAKALGGPPLAATLPASGTPALAAAKARELAEAYVAERGIDLSEQRVGSVTLQPGPGRPGAPHWLVQWAWSRARLGGEFGLRVYMDGRIEEARAGP